MTLKELALRMRCSRCEKKAAEESSHMGEPSENRLQELRRGLDQGWFAEDDRDRDLG